MRGSLPRQSFDPSADSTLAWRDAAVGEVAQRLRHKGFPCVFARNAGKKGLVRFMFVEGFDPEELDHLAEHLKSFLDSCRDWDGRVDSAPPLVVLFAPQVTAGCRSVRDFQDRGWWVLRELHRRDPAPWPVEIPISPEDPDWSMCFAGTPIFVNMSTPAHQQRHSRNLGEHLAFVVNPRERFDTLAGPTPRGRRARAVIRQRVDIYDDLPHSGDLGTYGSGSLEWHQYEIQDVDPPTHPERCPFLGQQA